MVDKMLAGRLPENQVLAALDAIGIGSFVGWFIGIAMAALGVGGSAIIARSMGAGRADEAGVALRRSMEFSLVWGALVGSILWLGVDPISRLMELSPGVIFTASTSALWRCRCRRQACSCHFDESAGRR